MALNDQTTKISYVGDGTATRFPGPFTVYDPAHVKVFTSGADGTALAVESGFEVLPEEDLTCTVSFHEPPRLGTPITIARILPLDQPLDLENGGSFSAEEIESALDEIVMRVQQLAEELDRAIKVAITSKNPAKDAEEIYAEVAAIVSRAEEALFRIQNIVQSVVLAKGVTNLRATWSTREALPAGSQLRLPVGYFPGRNMLLLMLDGLACHPAGPDVPPDLPQYEEVGGEDDFSREVRLLFDAPAKAVWSAWSVASNVSQHQEELAAEALAFRDEAREAAAEAQAAKIYVDNAIADAADIAAKQASEKAVIAAQDAMDALVAAARAAKNLAEQARDEAREAAEEAAGNVRDELAGLARTAQTARDEAREAAAETAGNVRAALAELTENAQAARDEAWRAASETADAVRAGLYDLLSELEAVIATAGEAALRVERAEAGAAETAARLDAARAVSEAAASMADASIIKFIGISNEMKGVREAAETAATSAANAARDALAAAHEAAQEAAAQAATLTTASLEERCAAYAEAAQQAAGEAKAAVSGASLHSPAGQRGGPVPAGEPFAVPAYTVGAGTLRLWLDGLLCVPGDDPARCQYREIGEPGSAGRHIAWHDDIADGHEIIAAVQPSSSK